MSARGDVNLTNMAEWRHTTGLLMREERTSEEASECSRREVQRRDGRMFKWRRRHMEEGWKGGRTEGRKDRR